MRAKFSALFQNLLLAALSTSIAAMAADTAAKKPPKRCVDIVNESSTQVYALQKKNGPPVVIVQGYMDNSKMCKQIAGFLNKDESRDSGFSCVKLGSGAAN